MTRFYAEREFQSVKTVAFETILRKEAQTYSKEGKTNTLFPLFIHIRSQLFEVGFKIFRN